MADVQRLESLPVHPYPEPAEDYRLEVGGLVARPMSLTAEDLAAMPQEEIFDEFACLEGWTVPGLRWRGVRMREVLERAGADRDAGWVQASVGGFSLPLPMAEARESLLALALNGEPIPQAHGAPVRLLVPDGECFTSVKWLARIEVRSEPAANTASEIALRRIGRAPA